MQTFSGKLVRLNVREWFEDPEFQAWFNQRLGKGLATWQNASAPLEPINLTPEACKALADTLLEEVITADVLFEPIGVGTLSEVKGEQQRLKEAEDALDKAYEVLKEASLNKGLTPEQARELHDLLDEKVSRADVFFAPGAIADPEVLEDEEERLDAAIEALGYVSERLQECFKKAQMEDLYAYADCFVGVDPGFSGEGIESDMPEKFWDVVVEAARNAPGPNPDGLHVVVWLSPSE